MQSWWWQVKGLSNWKKKKNKYFLLKFLKGTRSLEWIKLVGDWWRVWCTINIVQLQWHVLYVYVCCMGTSSEHEWGASFDDFLTTFSSAAKFRNSLHRKNKGCLVLGFGFGFWVLGFGFWLLSLSWSLSSAAYRLSSGRSAIAHQSVRAGQFPIHTCDFDLHATCKRTLFMALFDNKKHFDSLPAANQLQSVRAPSTLS